MNWKIQMRGAYGWADVKASVNNGPYKVDLFQTRQAARNEARQLMTGGYRVVRADVPQDWDAYCD